MTGIAPIWDSLADNNQLCTTEMVSGLIEAGAQFGIERGRLRVYECGSLQDWLYRNEDDVVDAILELTQVVGYRYVTHDAGEYLVDGRNRAGGLTLHMQPVVASDELIYVIFNVSLKRTRTTRTGKKGGALPKGHFLVGGRSKLAKFWASTGLRTPKPSSYHDFLGNLKPMIFEGSPHRSVRNRLADISPVNISYDQLKARISASWLTDKRQTRAGQATDNCQPTLPDKGSADSQAVSDLQGDSTTGDSDYGMRQQGNAVTRVGLDRYRWDEDYDQRDTAIAQKTHNQTRSITSRKGECT